MKPGAVAESYGRRVGSAAPSLSLTVAFWNSGRSRTSSRSTLTSFIGSLFIWKPRPTFISVRVRGKYQR